MASYPVHTAVNGKWSEWIYPARKGYKQCCCDCGLVHVLQFKLVTRNKDGAQKIMYRASRNNRSTALVRRHEKKKKAS